MTYLTTDERWAAVERRDRNAEGAFFTAVKTTGVYCLPSCQGRPHRKNVSFFDTADAARAAGYRACKLCKPDTPRETLRYATTPTDLGLALVAVSETGVRLITLGDDAASLAADLQRRFPKARLVADTGLEGALAEVCELVAKPGRTPSLQLDERGTALQAAVWKALRGIPAGQTASYTEVAHAIGKPSAVRAVAQACAANPLAVVTPCHRVVRSDGGLSGYRWGVERKAALLAREAAA